MLDRALLLWRLALRNLRLQRVKTLIVGFIFLVGTALTVIGNALVDSMDQGMAKSIIESMAGHLQIYDARAKNDLAIYGDEFAGLPDFGMMPDFAKVAAAVRAVPNVKAVVPMGSDYAFVSSGNELDRRLAELRDAVKVGDTEVIDFRRKLVRKLVELVVDDLKTAEVMVAEGSDMRAQLEAAKAATEPGFWAAFEADPLSKLEFLENKVAPLQSEQNFLGVWFVGTDPTAFAEHFSRFKIVKGEAIPPGQRGFLFNDGFYELLVKNSVARRLDLLVKKVKQGNRIGDDAALRSIRDSLPGQYRRIVFQLGPKETAAVTSALQLFLKSDEADLAELTKQFLTVDDANLIARRDFFYEHIAPRIELYGVRVGEDLTIRTFTRSGYARALNLKIYGTFAFEGLENSSITTQHNLMDLVSFRDLYGHMTPERRAEIEKMRAAAGVQDVAREDAEDALFGGDEALVAEAEQVDFKAVTDRVEAQTETPRTYRPDDLEDGLALHAAIILEDGSPAAVAAAKAAIAARSEAEGLGIKVATWQEASGLVGQLAVMVRVVLLIVSVVVGIVALVVVNNAMIMATMERTKEIGTMRAIGAGRGFVVWLFMTETFVLGVLAGGLGALVGALVVMGLGSSGIPATNEFLEFLFSGSHLKPVLLPRHLVLAVVNIVAVGVLATFYPARVAARTLPAEAMRR